MADVACPGFRFAGITAGIKASQRPDLGLIVADAEVPTAAAARGDGLEEFTRAIMTTDRFEKRALALLPLGPKTRARVVGVAKGAGMIAPNMATTLGFVATDAAVSKAFLKSALREEVEAT